MDIKESIALVNNLVAERGSAMENSAWNNVKITASIRHICPKCSNDKNTELFIKCDNCDELSNVLIK